MPATRRVRAADTDAVRVALPAPLPPRDASTLFREVAQTLLFLRAQLPGLYAEVRAAAEEAAAAPAAAREAGAGAAARAAARAARRSVDRRVRRAVASVEALSLELSPELLRALDVQALVLVLGSSSARPREAFELRLSVARESQDTLPDAPPPPQHGEPAPPPPPRGRDAGADAARRVTRALVHSLVTAPEGRSGMKLFVLLRVRPVEGSAVLHGWLPKRALRPAFHRAKLLRTVSLDAPQPQHATPAPPPPPPPPGEAAAPFAAASDDGCMWYQCSVTVRGLPRAKR